MRNITAKELKDLSKFYKLMGNELLEKEYKTEEEQLQAEMNKD